MSYKTQFLSFREAMVLANEVGIVEEQTDTDRVILVLKDGRAIHCISAYEEDQSDVTPGQGIMPPICEIHAVKPS